MKTLLLSAIIVGCLTLLSAASDQNIAGQRSLFANPPDDSRIMMRWWWFGPAVTKTELEREMKLMKQGGIGGFEVQAVYPLALDDDATGIRNLPFLSDRFLDALRFTSDKARELGLRIDLTLGSGWPYGGPQVSVRDAAGSLRIVRLTVQKEARRLALPDIGAGEKLLAAFLVRTRDKSIVGEEIRELTEIKDGAVILPDGLQEIYEALIFISSRSGMMVKRPAVGADGFVLNHYDRGAVEGYLTSLGNRLIQALQPHPPHAVFCDSLEVYGSDWTGGFLEEFRKRRGYDLTPHLPSLAYDLGPETPAIRCDWGRTLTELFNDNFMMPIHAWAQENGTLFRIQGYGIPPATIASSAHADISEGEGFQWKTVSASRWASSANHLFGRTVTSSETWTWLHSPVFRATPLDMKAEANLHFLQGINQLIGHGWPYSPETADYPGWRFYAAGVFNEKNPWWIVMPDITRCLQRSSWLLRQGAPANDIAFYLPVSDAYAGFSPGNVNLIESLRNRVGSEAVGAVLDAGFNLDFFDDDVLRQAGRIENGALALGPSRYRAVVLPNVERIPLDTYRMLDDFAHSGGIIIASRRQPAMAPGFAATEAEETEIRRISRDLFSSSSKNSRMVEDEKTQLAAALRTMLSPDLALAPEIPEIGFVHRKTGDAEIYFLANSSNFSRIAKASFRVAGLEAEWWDPMSGRITPARVSPDREGRTSLTLELEPYEGRFLVFSKCTTGKPAEPAVSAVESLDLSGNWHVTFGSTGVSKTMEHLSSWIDDKATKYFSGVAVYEKTVSIPESMLKPGTAQRLDFGEGTPAAVSSGSNGMQAFMNSPVLEAAVVYVNGQRAGSVWCPPYAVEVTGFLKRGDNAIRILVANTSVNQMSARALPDYRLLNQRYGKRFDPQDMDKIRPVQSGLLGPIRLIAMER
ncbi:MAG TPA: glycosyl hydrolase [Acidobacteriota bacterium]|nr:glycosyl hydrolase [Acidobacteriota bacterium]